MMAMPMSPVRIPAPGEVDVLRPQVGKAVGGGDDVGGHVGGEGGDGQRQKRQEDDDGVLDAGEELYRIPDGLAEDDGRCGGHRHADEGEKRHRRGKPQELAPHLRSLVPGEAGEVRDVQGQRGPESHHGREGGDEEDEELAGRLELAGVVEDRPQSSGAHDGPGEQREAGQDQERRRSGLEPLDGVAAPHDDVHVGQPETP